MSWSCVHCGTPIPNKENVKCPNCEENPFKRKKGELHPFNPVLIKRTIKEMNKAKPMKS